jgi:uncharacterized membrane-anchored protein
MGFTDILYLILWAGLAIYMFFSAHKISPILYIAGVFFTFMFAWYLINGLIPENLMDGVPGLVFKIICGCFLAVFLLFYYLNKRKNKS